MTQELPSYVCIFVTCIIPGIDFYHVGKFPYYHTIVALTLT